VDTLILGDKYQGAGGLLRPVQSLHTIFHLHHCLHHFITYHPHHISPSSTSSPPNHYITISPFSSLIQHHLHPHPYLFGVPHNMAARRTRAQLRPSQSKAAITTIAPMESPTTENLSEKQQAPSVIVVCPPSGEVPSKVPPTLESPSKDQPAPENLRVIPPAKEAPTKTSPTRASSTTLSQLKSPPEDQPPTKGPPEDTKSAENLTATLPRKEAPS
jgi:hypothetical protein